MKKGTIFCAAMLLLTVSHECFAGRLPSRIAAETEKKFSRANELYRQGSYDEAIAAYEQVLDSRLVSANVFYDIGNCYFKKGQLGRALLYYERGLRVAPRDRDILFNKDLTISRIDGYRDYASGALPARLGRHVLSALTVDEITILLIFVYVSLLGLVSVGLVRGSFSGTARLCSALLAVFFLLGSWALCVKIDRLDKDAVIVAKQATVKFEPFDQATQFFELREGTPVMLLEIKDSWMKVRRWDGKSGWLPRETLGII